MDKSVINIVGIDTSCDDTAIGLIDSNKNIINECKYSLDCKLYGGIVPELAARMHADKLDEIFKKTVENHPVDAIAATVGPGLISSVVLGSEFAKIYAKIKNIPFIPIHHLEGHIYAANIEQYPFLALLISGGHSDLYLCEEFGKYELIAKSLDDAVGEVFDKIGKHLELGFPSGPLVEKLAIKHTKCLEPMISMKNQLAFSFSGLKTKAIRIQNETKENVSWFLQESIGLTLKEKLQLAIKSTNVKNVIVCGGVAANKSIRNHIIEIPEINIQFPPINLCMDNGPMIAFAGLEHLKRNTKFVNNFEIEEFSRMTLTEFYTRFF